MKRHPFGIDTGGRTQCRALVTRALYLASCASACRPDPVRPPPQVVPDPIVILEGSVHLDEGGELAYRAIVAPDPKHRGQYLGTIDIPMQALSGASLEHIEFQPGRRIEFALALPGTPRWTGDFGDGGGIICRFEQGDISLPCSMRDVSAHRGAAPTLAGDGPRPSIER